MHTVDNDFRTSRFAMAMVSLCLAGSWLIAPGTALAQTDLGAPPSVADVASSLPSPDAIQTRIAGVEQAKDIEEPVRTQAIEAYKQALAQLAAARDWQAKADGFAAAAADAPARLAAVKKDLGTAASQPTSAVAVANLADLEQLLGKATAELGAAGKTAAADREPADTRPDQHTIRKKAIRAAKTDIGEITRKQPAAVATPLPPPFSLR